jgi:small-conductance mechanosensitive channel
MLNFLSLEFLSNTLAIWLKAAALTIGVYILLSLAKSLLVKKLTAIAARTENMLDDLVLKVVEQTRRQFLLALGLFSGSKFLSLPGNWVEIINKIFSVITALQVGLWLGGIINHLVVFREDKEEGSKKEQTAIRAFGLFGKILIWAIIGLVTLQNISGMELNALVTSLGIGGIAVGLAVQNILKDIFASLSIFLDKPFLVGDYIVVDDTGGTVENIGLKSTRIRTLLGEEVIFSNSNLLESRIHNFRKLERRLVVINIGISPETSHESLQGLPDLFKEIIQQQKKATFDRANLNEIADYTLNYEIVFHIESAEYDVFMNTKESVLLEIIKRLQEKDINMPYPTQAILLNK